MLLLYKLYVDDAARRVKRLGATGESDGLSLADSNLLHRSPPFAYKAIAKSVKYNELFKFEKLIMYLLFRSIIKAILFVKGDRICFDINIEM